MASNYQLREHQVGDPGVMRKGLESVAVDLEELWGPHKPRKVARLKY